MSNNLTTFGLTALLHPDDDDRIGMLTFDDFLDRQRCLKRSEHPGYLLNGGINLIGNSSSVHDYLFANVAVNETAATGCEWALRASLYYFSTPRNNFCSRQRGFYTFVEGVIFASSH